MSAESMLDVAGSNGWILGSDEDEDNSYVIYFGYDVLESGQVKVESVVDGGHFTDTFQEFTGTPAEAVAEAYAMYALGADVCTENDVQPFEHGESLTKFPDDMKADLTKLGLI